MFVKIADFLYLFDFLKSLNIFPKVSLGKKDESNGRFATCFFLQLQDYGFVIM